MDPDIPKHSRPSEESAERDDGRSERPPTVHVSDETADKNNAAPSDACDGLLTADQTPLPCRPRRVSD